MQQKVETRPQQPSPRIEAERERRRRRDDMGLGRMRNLSVAGDMDPNYVYRWINDDPGRVHKLTVMDDWDAVSTAQLGAAHEKDKGIGTTVERIVGKHDGKKAVLVRKRRDYYLEDKAKEQAAVDGSEHMIRRGKAQGGEGLQESDPHHAYIPQGGISIQSGGKSSGYTP